MGVSPDNACPYSFTYEKDSATHHASFWPCRRFQKNHWKLVFMSVTLCHTTRVVLYLCIIASFIWYRAKNFVLTKFIERRCVDTTAFEIENEGRERYAVGSDAEDAWNISLG